MCFFIGYVARAHPSKARSAAVGLDNGPPSDSLRDVCVGPVLQRLTRLCICGPECGPTAQQLFLSIIKHGIPLAKRF